MGRLTMAGAASATLFVFSCQLDAGQLARDAPLQPGSESEDGGTAGARDGGVTDSPEDLTDGHPPPGASTRIESVCLQNLTSHGGDALCASCACGRCSDEAEACHGDAACAAAASCMVSHGCHGVDCYCGGDLLGCLFRVPGACKDSYEAAAGGAGEAAIRAALAQPDSPLARAQALAQCSRSVRCQVACGPADTSCGFNDLSCQQRYCQQDDAREAQRAASAQESAQPKIARVLVNGREAWSAVAGGAAEVGPGDTVVLEGTGFGAGPDVDFSKLLIGNVRVLETDLTMYEQQLDIARQVHSETSQVRSRWAKDIVSWSDERVEFMVPGHVAHGPIKLQVQKRTGANESYVLPGQMHTVIDAQTLRVVDAKFQHQCDVVSTLSDPVGSNEVPVSVRNPELATLVQKGREIFWSYDYNIGLTHSIRGLDWTALLQKKTIDPITKLSADPEALIGAVPTVPGEVPSAALDDVRFDPYPQKNPIPGYLLVLSQQKTAGNTRNSGYVGYRYAEATNPYTGDGSWIGFNCASCHGYRIRWESAPGQVTTKVIAGLPNPRWSMKWAVLGGNFKGVIGDEPGPIWDPEVKRVDKTPLIYAVPHGHGEHDLVRFHGEGSMTDNDYGFAPIAIPGVTYYLPIRRSLSHTESYVGFEGSYIHAEEPDGALGSMDADSLKALTAYMGQLDGDDEQLRAVGVYRWLQHEGQGALTEGASEGEFVQKGPRAFAKVAARLDAGAQIFARDCASCHQDEVGQYTSERMLPLHEVGRFFEPTIYHREMQSVRVSFLRNVYWLQHRGLLSDGHVRNARELVHPDRCKEGTALYDRYYTLHAPVQLDSAGPDFPTPLPHENPRGDVFRVLRGTDDSETSRARNTFIERYRYFSAVDWDPEHYYWDYQKLRREYGPWELGSAAPIGLPAAPHPWCAKTAADVDDLTLYLMSL